MDEVSSELRFAGDEVESWWQPVIGAECIWSDGGD